MKDTDLAYIAGVIDSDGSIIINKSYSKKGYKKGYKLSLRLAVGSTSEKIIDWLKQMVGGCSYIDTRLPPRKTYYWWRIHSRQASNLLEAILPFLVIKRKESQLAIEFQGLKKRQNTLNEPQRQDELFNEIKKYHSKKGGNAKHV